LEYSDGQTTQNEQFNNIQILPETSEQLSFLQKYNIAGFSQLSAYIVKINGEEYKSNINNINFFCQI
jgi:hypothetical protein